MATNTRKIHTKLYSDKAHEMLQSVLGQLSDGIWENSPAMDKYWRFASIGRADNNEVIIEVSTENYIRENYYGRVRYLSNEFFGEADDNIIKWFASKLKQITKTEMKDDDSVGAWKRDNMKLVSYLGYKQQISVRDVYVIYDFLNGRSIIKYDNANEIIGTKASDEDTKAAATKREQLEHEAEIYAANRKTVDDWEKSEIERIKKEAEAKRHTFWETYSKIRKELEK